MPKFLVLLNSKDRITGTPSACDLQIASSIQDAKYVSLNSFECVNSILNINNNNNRLEFALRSLGNTNSLSFIDESEDVIFPYGTNDFKFNLPTGNYKLDTFATALQTAFNAATSTLFVGFANPVWSVTSNSNTGKLTIILTVPNISWTFALNKNSPLANVMGYKTSRFKVPTIANNVSTCSVTGDGLVDLRGITDLYIHSNIVQTNSLTSNGRFQKVLGKVDINVPIGDTVFFKQKFADEHRYDSMGNISLIHISIRDSAGNLIDLQGMDWSATLIIES